LPFVLAGNPKISEGLQTGAADPNTNDQLRLLAQEAKLEAIYLMDADGLVLATSNAEEPHSFLGQNYEFRPYFQDALNGQRSDYFAIGVTSGRPGYFVAEPISSALGTRTGVIAIKLDISELQRSWESNNETVVATNKNNIVVLASNPDWLYRPIAELSPEVRSTILESRQFGSEPLNPIDWIQLDRNRVAVDGTKYIVASSGADWRDWTVHFLHPEAHISRQTLLATGLFGILIALLLGFATFLRSRRIELAYNESELQRGKLIEANQRLERAQAELARSANLAALGHLAASVTHELGQPISAFRNHLAAAEIGNEITSPKTAENLNKLVDRMEAITAQFRYFARGRVDEKAHVKLRPVLEEVEGLLMTEIQTTGIDFHPAKISDSIVLRAHKVQLEQVFTNLIRNAVHAVENVDNPEIWVTVTRGLDTVEIRVTDNGPGLADASLKDLQEPFFSTKPSGVGMGLGLAIATEIIKDHGGKLAIGTPATGAEFIVTLPLSQVGETA
jgi:two-component system C4-dicarboxylate transport sensor histidine kinase DctB